MAHDANAKTNIIAPNDTNFFGILKIYSMTATKMEIVLIRNRNIIIVLYILAIIFFYIKILLLIISLVNPIHTLTSEQIRNLIPKM